MFSLQILVLSLAGLASAFPTTEVAPRQTKSYQIRGVQDPIFHLYLQGLPSNKSIPVMGPEATSEYFVIGSTIQSTNSSLYLNLGNSSTSYLPLSFDTTSTTTAWGLEGDTIITADGSKYGRRKLFCHKVFAQKFTKGERTQLSGLRLSYVRLLQFVPTDGQRYPEWANMQQLPNNSPTLPLLARDEGYVIFEVWSRTRGRQNEMQYISQKSYAVYIYNGAHTNGGVVQGPPMQGLNSKRDLFRALISGQTSTSNRGFHICTCLMLQLRLRYYCGLQH